MKKLVCLLAVIGISCGLYAFDRSLNGSWGLVTPDDRDEVIRFNTNEIVIFDELFRPKKDYEEGEDTIYIEDAGGDSVMIQYYRLAPNKLLFILSNLDDPSQSLTLILTKL
jgi:hypothetical protein